MMVFILILLMLGLGVGFAIVYSWTHLLEGDGDSIDVLFTAGTRTGKLYYSLRRSCRALFTISILL
jgi:hypothetical protein